MSKNLYQTQLIVDNPNLLPNLVGITKENYLEYQDLKKEKEKLIKYLEEEISHLINSEFELNQGGRERYFTLKEVLEKVKSGKYE